MLAVFMPGSGPLEIEVDAIEHMRTKVLAAADDSLPVSEETFGLAERVSG